MARPKEFDPDEVLGKIMDQFWIHGYEGTSMDDLVRAAGIGRQSLYDTFGDKRALYLAALDRFVATDGSVLLPILAKKGPLRATMRDFFDAVVDLALEDRDARGCMIVNASSNLGAGDADVKRRVRAANESLEHALSRRIEAALSSREIGRGHTAQALARFFVATVIGIRTTAKTVRDRKHLRSIADLALSVLR
jgi:TetR/AcrR family transcriptional repressor of nem operon